METGRRGISEFVKKHARTILLATAGAGVGVAGVSIADTHMNTLPARHEVASTVPYDKSVPFDFDYNKKLEAKLKETGIEDMYNRDIIIFIAGGLLASIAVIGLSESKNKSVSVNNHLSPQTSA